MLKTFDEFKFDKEKIGIAGQTFEDFKYLNLYDEVRKKDKRAIESISSR